MFHTDQLCDPGLHAWEHTHMANPVIIEAALNGVTSPARNPNVPATPIYIKSVKRKDK